MPTIEELKSTVNGAIDEGAERAVRVAHAVLENPEPGFRERKTARIVAEQFRKLGIPYQDGIAITGIKGVLDSGTPGPTVAVMGELDSLIVPGHPYADPGTNAAHACGHHCQIGMMLGVAMGLQAKGVLESLAGRVALLAVPAEEYIEIEYRDGLRRRGELEFLGGKSEMVRLGTLDDVDMAMMTHTTAYHEDASFLLGATNNGMVAKRIAFAGRAAHAGSSPHEGINALNAAMISLTAIHAQRETFRDEDTIRVHPIITRGGGAVNAVPDDVRMETFVRGRSIEACLSAGRKVDRCLRAGALAVGGSVRITTLPGYLPIQNSPALLEVFESNAGRLVGQSKIVREQHRSGSTDMGDVSRLMPAIHPYVVAASGNAHGTDYVIDDYSLAVITAAKAMAMTVVDLLAEGGRKASEIKGRFKPDMSKSEYLTFMRNLLAEETFAE